MLIHGLEQAYHDLLLRNHVPYDKFGAVSGRLRGVTSEEYGEVVLNLLDLTRKILGWYVHV